MGRDLTSLRLPETLRPGNQALVNLAERHGLELVVLFGSRAKGTAHPTSDFDLAVLPEAGTPGGCGSDAKGLLSAEDARRLMALHTDLQHLLRTDRIDLVPLQCASALLAHRIARDGLPLYERAPGAFAGFCVRSVQRHEDARILAQAERAYLRRQFAEPASP